jgi:hypothetical protein
VIYDFVTEYLETNRVALPTTSAPSTPSANRASSTWSACAATTCWSP